MAVEPSSEFNAAEANVLARYFTNLDRPVFALRNLPEVVKGALFSRYSRTEKSLRRVLLDEFINEPGSGFDSLGAAAAAAADDMVAVQRAEEFYERVLVGYGDDSVAELAGAHVAVEQTSKLAAHDLPECRKLAGDLHRELALVIPAFVRRALDERYGGPAAERMARAREATAALAPRGERAPAAPAVRLVEYDRDAERKIV